MTTYNEIAAYVLTSATNEDLTNLTHAIAIRRSDLARSAKRQLRIGSQAKFTNPRTGQTVVGTVEKIAIKYVKLRESQNSLWKVPASMLTCVP